jgi:integrase
LGRYLGESSPDPDADDAADDPCAVTRAHVEAFQAWMIDTRSALTALNKHKGLQQFFKWLLVDEQAIDRSSMERVRQPKTPRKLIPVLRDEDTGKLLDACKGKGFVDLRDEALIRLYCNTGVRLSEVGNLLMADVDLNAESVHFHGKGAKDRRVRFGPKTARALSRYLRARLPHGFGSIDTGVPNHKRNDGLPRYDVPVSGISSPGEDGPTFLDLLWDQAPFAAHGDFVSAVARTAEAFVTAGVLTDAEKDRVVSDAARASKELAP